MPSITTRTTSPTFSSPSGNGVDEMDGRPGQMIGEVTRRAILAAALLGVALPSSALADTTIDFEQHPAGTAISDQYAGFGGPGQGVLFGPLPSGNPGEGLRPVVRVAPAGQAMSGSQVADIATCVGCEFFTPRTTGTFSIPRSQVSVRAGYLGDSGICTAINPNAVTCAVVTLRGFDASGVKVAESSVRVSRGAGIKSQLSVSTQSPAIVGFEISGRPAIDDSKPIAIDDLNLGTPPPTVVPDFTLSPSTTRLIVEQGRSTTIPITIGRLGGSSGDLSLSEDGLPAGITAAFAPNPAPGTQSILTLSADPTAPPATQAASITGVPQSASVGPVPRSVKLSVTIQRACPQVDAAKELVDALAAQFRCVFVTGRIDLVRGLRGVEVPAHLTDDATALVIPDGVTLMGARSPTRPGGTLAMSRCRIPARVCKRFMLKVGGGTRIEGLRLAGYNERDTTDRDDGTTAIYVQGGSVVIENNEIFGWPAAGVEVADSPTDRRFAPLIARNYIHSNVQCSLGYGVTVDTPSGFARIERNVFAFNRHHIAGSGGPGPGYIATLNFALHRGPTCGGNYNQHFDVHGQHGGYGGAAGTFYEISRNTFRGAQSYGFNGRLTRPAFELRGTPEDRAVFASNAVAHDSLHGAVRVKRNKRGDAANVLRTTLIHLKRLVIRGNKTCVDTAHELAVGDFDGDGHDDVFQAAGTLWVYSPAGRREWFFLNASDLRLRDLGLGDFDGDGRTDVLSQRGGRWFVSHGGTSRPRPLAGGSSIDVASLRFGDFDGDRRTDVFRTNGRQFFYSSAGTTGWLPLASSRLETDEVRLGDFDGDGTTDVFSLANNQWSVSDGARGRWRRLNRKLSPKLGGLVIADFNGDRKSDIARTNGSRWEVSSGGATEWRTLAHGRSEPLSTGMLFGDFNGDGRADVLQHGEKSALPMQGCGRVRFKSFDSFRLSPGGARPLRGWSLAHMR